MRNILNFIFFFAFSLCPLQSHAVSESKCDVPGFDNKEYTINEAIKIGKARHYRDLVAGLKKALASDPRLGNKKSKICRRSFAPGANAPDPQACGLWIKDNCTKSPFKEFDETCCCDQPIGDTVMAQMCCGC